MIPGLLQMLIRFRMGSYAGCSDIAEAFLMDGYVENDRLHSTLEARDPADQNSPVDILYFEVMLFGAACSPFVLNATIDYHLKKYGGLQVVTDKIRRNTNVDNNLGTASAKAEWNEFQAQSRRIFGEARLNQSIMGNRYP